MKRRTKRDRYLHLISLISMVFPVLFYVLMTWSTARYGIMGGSIDITALNDTGSKLYTALFTVDLIIILLFALTLVVAVLSLLFDNLLQFRLLGNCLLLLSGVSLGMEIAYLSIAIPSGLYESVCDILISVFTLVYFGVSLAAWFFIVKRPYDNYLVEKYEDIKKKELAELEAKAGDALKEEPQQEDDLTPEQRREKIKAMIEVAREKNALSQEEADALLSELEETKES